MLDNIIKTRIEKLEKIKRKQNPYPAKTERTYSNKEAKENFENLKGENLVLAGRLLAIREHGGSLFANIYDGTQDIQIFLKKDVLKDEFDFFQEVVDVGDFISAGGTLFMTKKEEKTLEVSEWKMAAKSLRPLPEKWHGLKDIEERYRKRHLDLLMNEEVKERFQKRSFILKEIRNFLDRKGFSEVETPVLQHLPGGATARPFVTRHNALDQDLYLRIAPELYLKRLLVGGFEKIYELGRNFRNEGIDKEHNPEFTMLELYAAYKDRDYLMSLMEEMFGFVGEMTGIVSGGKLKHGDDEIELKSPWRRLTFKEALEQFTGIDYDEMSGEEMKEKSKELKIKIDKDAKSKADIADDIYKKFCRPRVVQPVFITDHPLEISPLAKRDPENSETALRFQLLIGGMEMINGFSELNDPREQRERFERQEKARREGNEEAQRMDEDFLEAMEYGLPPAAGLGVGIDRMIALFTDASNLKEVILFPTLKSK